MFHNRLYSKVLGIIGLEPGISEVLKNIARREMIVRLKIDSLLDIFVLVPMQVL